MDCHGTEGKIVTPKIEGGDIQRVLLMGNPNVGKSVVFSRLTGVKTIASNYPGTTVGFTQGFMKIGEQRVQVTDVPGTYTLEPTSEAEEIAARILENGDVVINVVDATNLERNLNLTLQLQEKGLPMVVALNIWDDAKHRGIKIDLQRLEDLLGVPVIPTVGVTGEGVKELVESIPFARKPLGLPRSQDERWVEIGKIIAQVQQVTHRHHTWRERLSDATVRPVSGALFALLVIVSTFFLVRFVGESLINYVMNPIFHNLWTPLLLLLSRLIGGAGVLHTILLGNIVSGGISYGEISYGASYGLLTTGLYVPVAMVLPYLFSFYLALGLLEDTGYLPRLAVLMDTIMHRLGLHGYAIIPNLLGLGCNVPAILATRILESKRERFIAATLISIAVPCAALQAMIFGLVGAKGWHYVGIVYGTLFAVWIVLGVILNRFVKGFSPELLIEIPPYRFPVWQATLQKLWLRVFDFLKDALPIMLGAIFFINILHELGVFELIAKFTAPLMTGVLGLPPEAAIALVIGFLRKDAAVGMLVPLALTAKQLVVGSVVLAMFFPCIATFIVLLRELGIGGLLRSLAIMIVLTFAVGGILNLVL